MTKCIYCDFNHLDHIGAEINSGSYIPEKEMLEADFEEGRYYDYLSLDEGSFWFTTLHTDNEGYSSDGDSTAIKFCPMCGRRLEDDD